MSFSRRWTAPSPRLAERLSRLERVSQDALLIVTVDSWSSLGFKMWAVPNLHRLIVTKWKVALFFSSGGDGSESLCKDFSLRRGRIMRESGYSASQADS
ncbi:hypothetical protein FH972_014942 [Carpinus fangiana]|uniref:Uncharacterized protein n=1 Tax=Carpinus fangiana TaxID=176857 RepID=A0A5N6REQ0_9ROSI|nr:hypothetical protein FH972_014942 [Carpinus fangiana]